MSAYDNVQKGALKLKGSSGVVKKKKKKSKDKEKEKQKMLAQIPRTEEPESPTAGYHKDTRTKAELAFHMAQERRGARTLLEKAGKTHKERIMEFNEKLDALTEHYDIPKVSWTK